MKKDILFLCQFFYPEHNSSATLPFDTAQYLANHGFSVDALCGYPKEYSDSQNVPIREVKDGVCIRRLRYLQVGRVSTVGRLINYFSFTVSALFHVFQLRKYKSVIVYSNPPILPFVAVLGNVFFKIKIVFVAYDVYPEIAHVSGSLQAGNFIDRGMRWLNHQLYKRASYVVALSEEMKMFLLDHRPEISEDRIAIIPNWAHEKKAICPTTESFKRFGFCPEQLIVSYFGNMGTCQDMETLLHALMQLKGDQNIRFLFVGHGNKKNHVEEVVKMAGNGRVYGFLTGDVFEEALAISSYCVVSLEKGLKGMCAPSKYYSYLQGGKPIIAIVEKDSYLAREVTDEQIGHCVEIGNVGKLVSIMKNDLLDPDKQAVMGNKSKKLYNSKYSFEIGINRYIELLIKLCNK